MLVYFGCSVNCDPQKLKGFGQKLTLPFGQKPDGFLQCIQHCPDSSKMQILRIPCRIRDWGKDADIVDVVDDEVVIGLVGEVGAIDGGKKALQDSGTEGVA